MFWYVDLTQPNLNYLQMFGLSLFFCRKSTKINHLNLTGLSHNFDISNLNRLDYTASLIF